MKIKNQIKFIKIAYIAIIIIIVAFGFFNGGKQGFMDGWNDADQSGSITYTSDVLLEPKDALKINAINTNTGDTLIFKPKYFATVAVHAKKAGATNGYLSFLKGCLVLMIAFLGLRILVFLYVFISSVQEGNVFSEENIKRLSKMGWYALILPVIILAYDFVGIKISEAIFINQPYRVVADLSFETWPIILGITLLTIAFVFKKGLQLKQENDLTI